MRPQLAVQRAISADGALRNAAALATLGGRGCVRAAAELHALEGVRTTWNMTLTFSSQCSSLVRTPALSRSWLASSRPKRGLLVSRCARARTLRADTAAGLSRVRCHSPRQSRSTLMLCLQPWRHTPPAFAQSCRVFPLRLVAPFISARLHRAFTFRGSFLPESPHSVSTSISIYTFLARVMRQMTTPSNHALQRTAAGRRGCNWRVSWPPSLSLCRWPDL